jgi:anti-anti-sigma regulatory factor
MFRGFRPDRHVDPPRHRRRPGQLSRAVVRGGERHLQVDRLAQVCGSDAGARRELLLLAETERPSKAIVDFCRVVHCSTAVMNGLLRAKRRIIASGGELKLCGMTAGIGDAYKILNLDGTVFQIYDTLADAMLAF